MPVRVRRSYKILPGVRLNVGKRGASISSKFGPVTVNSRRGATVHVAKGVSYTSGTGVKRRRNTQQAIVQKPTSGGCCLWPFMFGFAGLVLLCRRYIIRRDIA